MNYNEQTSVHGGDTELAGSRTSQDTNDPRQTAQELASQMTTRMSIEFRTRSWTIQDAQQQGAPTTVTVTMPTIALPAPTVPAKPVLTTEEKEIKKEVEYDIHTASVQTLAERFQTNIDTGLSDDQAAKNQAEHGANKLILKGENKVLKFLGYFFSGFSLLLWPAALLCFLAYYPLGMPNPDSNNLGLAILLVVVVVTQGLFTAWQDFRSSQVMASISNMLPASTSVLRNGVIKSELVEKLTLGDIVHLSNGNKVPADLRLIEVQQLKVDNSILTGESEPISSTLHCTDPNYMETRNLAFMGAAVVDGSGIGIVVGIGNNTVMGKIAKLASSNSSRSSTLRVEIRRFAILVGVLSITTGAICILYWALYLNALYPNFMSVSTMLTTVIALVVAYMPGGLPVSVTLTLTMLAKRMFAQNVLVKNIPTVETLGSVDIIASDKTGTLTQNKMSVANVFSGSRLLQAGASCRKVYEAQDAAFHELIRVVSLCNRACFEELSEHLPLAQRKVSGDASDTGLLLFAEDFHPVTNYRLKFKKLYEVPFNSKNKWMLTITTPLSLQPSASNININLSSSDLGSTSNLNALHNPVILMKGAGDILVERCISYLQADGSEVPMTAALRSNIFATLEHLSSEGQRVLALCKKRLDPAAFPADFVYSTDDKNFPTTELCFVGLVALMDPPRVDVLEAIRQCKGGGIKVMMVTGDHPSTAAAIARMVGIIGPRSVAHDLDTALKLKAEQQKHYRPRALVIKGSELAAALDKTVWDFILQHDEIVFARTTPEHKLKIVKECQARKHIVAVTGDGVNDAPALKQADCGVAMGAGSDVAKEAADIVLLDSKFSSIIVGIENGRLVFENLRKVILYLLPAGSWSELLPILAYVFLGVPLPLSAFLMIVICLVTDMFASLSLIPEKAEGSLMKKKPRVTSKESLISLKIIALAYGFTGMIESTAAFTMFFWYMYAFGGFTVGDLLFVYDKYTAGFHGKTQLELDNLLFTGQTVFFVTLVIMQCGNILATRTRYLSFFQHNPFRKATRNTSLLLAIIVALNLTVWIVYLPGINSTFNTRAIPDYFWFAPMPFSLALFTLDELRKVLLRRLQKRRRLIKEKKALLEGGVSSSVSLDYLDAHHRV